MIESLLAEVVAHPDDDAARMVWADAVGGERGELVALQCNLARGGVPPRLAGARRARVRELLAQHGHAWAALDGLAVGAHFRAGFVEAVDLPVRSFVTHHAALFAAAPALTTASVYGFDGRLDLETSEASGVNPIRELRALLASPALDRLTGLGLGRIGRVTERDSEMSSIGWQSDDDAIGILVGDGVLERMRAVELAQLTPAGAHPLIAQRTLAHVERLALVRPELGSDALSALFHTLENVRILDVEGDLPIEVIAKLPATVVELRVHGLRDAGFAALASSPIAATLERLRVLFARLEIDASPLGHLPRLRSLGFDSLTLGLRPSRPSGIRERVRGPSPSPDAETPLASMLRLELPALRELRMPGLSAEQLVRVARAFGPQLEMLDVGHHDRTSDEVRALVAGEVFVNPDLELPRPLTARDGLAWDPPMLRLRNKLR